MTGNASVTMKIANPDPGAVARESDIYAELLPLAGARVIELGCGAADHTLRIAKKYPTARITGFEVDAIQHAKNLKAAAPENVRFVEGGAQRILATDASADVVLMFKSLHHVPVSEMDTALAEIARVLVPGGLAYISEPVFAGELNDIIRIFNDEQHVRQHAFDAVRRAVERGLFELVTERFFSAARTYPDLADFERAHFEVTFRDTRHTPEQIAAVREKFVRHLGPEGARFEQPMRIDLLRKPVPASR
jgi:ubiquinone/menaquinone biosynthesis C-methylase UbiE